MQLPSHHRLMPLEDRSKSSALPVNPGVEVATERDRMKEDLHRLLGFDVARSIRNLLEDFESIGVGQYSALIPSCDFDSYLHENVEAAVVASKLHLSSIDYAKRKYCYEKVVADNTETEQAARKYKNAYKASKRYIKAMLSKASPTFTVTPLLGSFGAAIALTRLQYSFFSAHILYQLGHQYEAHAVSRLILEQIAWAYSASQLDNLDDIKRLVTTNCIGKLKELNQDYGRLYGVLSNKVHIDYGNHGEFLRVEDGENIVLLTHSNFAEYAFVMLALTDLFGVVWEISQASHIQDFEATEFIDGTRSIRADRPFRKTANQHLTEFQKEGDEIDPERNAV